MFDLSTSPVSSKLETTCFDRVNSGLISMISVCGFVVITLFCLWWNHTPQQDFNGGIILPVPHEYEPSDDEVLSLDDFPEDILEQRKFEDVIQSVPSVTDELSKVIAGGENGRDAWNRSIPGGIPPILPPDPLPEHRRWKVKYEAESLAQYKLQLDFFNIELGAVSTESNEIFRLKNLSTDKFRVVESNRRQERDSLYFAHENVRLKRWDKLIVRKAGLRTKCEVVQFFSDMATAKMREAELDYLKDQSRELDEVARTHFKVVASETGWYILVEKMDFKESGRGR